MFADFFADLRFNCPVVLFAKEIAKVNPENRFYAYRFDRLSIVSDKMHCYDWMGVCHGSDILYTFSHPFMNYYPPDARLSHDMIKSWTKFARTGQPGPIGPFEWPKAFDSNNNSSIQLSTSSMNNDIRWAFSQIKGPLDEEVAEGMNMKNFKNFSYNQIFSKTADIISCVEFSHDGELLATGDKGGRVVIFQRDPFVIIIFKKFFLQVC